MVKEVKKVVMFKFAIIHFFQHRTPWNSTNEHLAGLFEFWLWIEEQCYQSADM